MRSARRAPQRPRMQLSGREIRPRASSRPPVQDTRPNRLASYTDSVGRSCTFSVAETLGVTPRGNQNLPPGWRAGLRPPLPQWPRRPVYRASRLPPCLEMGELLADPFWQRRTNVWRRVTNLARGRSD